MKIKRVLTFLLSMLLVSGMAKAQDYSDDNRTLLEIGDEKVSVAEFMHVYQKNNVENEVIDKKSLEEYLELYINFKLKVREAEALGLDTAQAFIDELSGYRKQLTKPYFVDEGVNEQLLEEAYNRKLMDLRASHILIRLDENASPEDTLAAYNKILEVKQKAESGEDFGELAVEYSEDPSARDMDAIPGQRPARKGNRGDLGYFSVFDMLYPFESAAYETEVGGISDIVRTRYGYHLIKVTDKKEAMGTATVAHIYVAFPQDASAQDSIMAESRIQKAWEEIQEGTKFEEAAKKYSDDRGSREKGGALPPFGSNRMVPEFIVAVSKLNELGDISEPVLTQYGWHIIKLIDRDEPGTLEEEKASIKERLQRDTRSHKSTTAIIQKVKKDYKFKEYDKRKDDILALLDSSLYQRKWDADTASKLNKTLFRIGKEKYTQYDFAKYLESKQNRIKKAPIENFFQSTYDEYVDEKAIEFLDERLEEIYPDFGRLMKEYRDGILLFELTDQKVWSKAVKDTAGLESFYRENKEDYMWGERLQASIFTVTDRAMLAEIRRKASGGTKPQEILDMYNSDSLQVVNVESDKFSVGENEFIDKIEWEKGISRSFRENGQSLFVMVHKVLPPEPKTLNEARGIITADYQNYLEKQWIQQLRDKYTVEVNEKVLESIN